MSNEKRWDVFLSYASPDRAEVEKLALRLEDEAGLKVFLDKWRLVPGERFIPGLQDALRASRSCAVFIGSENIRPWQNVEMETALSRAVSRAEQSGDSAFRIIPVLLPGALGLSEGQIPDFIGLQTWVDFRSPKRLDDAEAFARLVAGIRGEQPGRLRTPPTWLTIIRLPNLERPTGIAADGKAIIVADHATGQILRVENGVVVQSYAGLVKPHHLVVMSDSIVVTSTQDHQLFLFDQQLNVRSKKAQLDDYILKRPHGLASNFPDEFYVADSDNHRILLVRSGDVVAVAGRPGSRSGLDSGEFSVPCGIAASPDCIYVADTYNHRCQVLTRDLRFLFSFGTTGRGSGQFAYPVGVAVWQEWIVVADEQNRRLQLWRRESEGLPFDVTSVTSDLLGGWLGSPFGLCFDEDACLLVADRKDGQLLRIDFVKMLAQLPNRIANA